MERIALFGGAFDPFGNHHLEVVNALLKCPFVDLVTVFPSGDRPDKPYITKGVHRGEMIRLACERLRRVQVDLSDITEGTYSRAWDLQMKFGKKYEVLHVIGSDWLVPGEDGVVPVKKWFKGNELWDNAQFLIVSRPGFEYGAIQTPTKSFTLKLEKGGSSTEIRNLMKAGKCISGLVDPKVEKYIYENELYV